MEDQNAICLTQVNENGFMRDKELGESIIRNPKR